MTRENYFTKKFQKTSKELESIIDNKSQFDQKAVQAAIWILEDRGDRSQTTDFAQQHLDEKTKTEQSELTSKLGISINTLPWTSRLLHSIIDTILIQSISYFVALLPFVNFSLKFSLSIFPVYYIFFEYKFRQTPGKMVTDSIVTNADGSSPSLNSVILRTAARYIPFEALTCLGRPSWGWHDKWTNTYVVKKSDLDRLQ